MVSLVESLATFSKKNILLIGDLMLDTYTMGKVKRISPEAPVSVLQVEKEEEKPGGAGNVALNLQALGMNPLLVGRIGNDVTSEKLKNTLLKEGVDTSYLFFEEGYRVPLKNRIIAENQQMMRVDFETITFLKDEVAFIEKIKLLIDQVDVIAISDYAKGLLSDTVLKQLFDLAFDKQKTVIVDPKGTDFTKYKGASIIKPNQSEATLASGLRHDAPLDFIADALFEKTGAQAFFITRSEEGISLFQRGLSRKDFPVEVKEVKDVTGAGDTVLAVLATSIANGLNYELASSLANIAAGIAIEHFGCAKVYLADIAKRMLKGSIGNKVFDDKHLYALKLALKDRPFTVLSIDSENGLTTPIFKAIKNLSLNASSALIIYAKDGHLNNEFISLLASLQEVDFIVLKNDSLNRLCNELKPHAFYSLIQDDATLIV
jgi:D-beta-D-heptose 7-phosphate kinase/D-beta-D-heptose 1-phosphate adenosyltransferase